MPFHPYTVRPQHECPSGREHCANELWCDECRAHICADEYAYITSVEEQFPRPGQKTEGVQFVRHVLCNECYHSIRI